MGSDSLILSLNRSDSSSSSDDFEFNCSYTNMPESPRLIQSSVNLSVYATSEINLCSNDSHRVNDIYIFDDPCLSSDYLEFMNDNPYPLYPNNTDSAMISDTHLNNRYINNPHFGENHHLQSWSAPESPINQSNRSFKPNSIGYELQLSSLSDTEESIKDATTRNYQHKSKQGNRDGANTEMRMCRRRCKMMKWDGLINTRMLLSPKWNKSKQSSATSSKINRDSLAMISKLRAASKVINRDGACINKGSSSSPTVKCKESCRTMSFLGTCLGVF